jgi:hypothetical protein
MLVFAGCGRLLKKASVQKIEKAVALILAGKLPWAGYTKRP